MRERESCSFSRQHPRQVRLPPLLFAAPPPLFIPQRCLLTKEGRDRKYSPSLPYWSPSSFPEDQSPLPLVLSLTYRTLETRNEEEEEETRGRIEPSLAPK